MRCRRKTLLHCNLITGNVKVYCSYLLYNTLTLIIWYSEHTRTALTTCQSKICDPLAYCGLEIDGTEICYCPHGYSLDPDGKSRCDGTQLVISIIVIIK